jgi:DNA-binding response OmpR family regulator
MTMRPILILDDDADLLGLLKRALQREGRSVMTATDAATALDLSARERPALIIADLMLPHVDGETFLRQYRRQWPDSTCPVMLLTASAVRQEVAERMQVTASLPKPFALDDLRALVAELTSDEGSVDSEG